MVDAAFYHEEYKQVYFFGGTRYARVKFTPGYDDDEITFGPAKLAPYWPSLVKAGFGTVEAALPVQGTTDQGYFFFGGQFAQIKVVPEKTDDTVVGGPWKITERLKCLETTGFDTIDAAMNVPGKADEVYFFRGTKYVRVNIKTNAILHGADEIAAQWPGLTEAGFDSVDAILPVPGSTTGDAYFFKGDKYVKIRVTPSAPDKIIYGPKPLADHWKSLDWI